MDRQPIADADRDRVIAGLQRGHASGYLDQTTLNRRMEVALATDDPDELHALVTDLPDLAGQTWSPTAGQRLSPFETMPPSMGQPYQPTAEPAWRQFLRNAGSSWIIGLVVALIMVIALSQANASWFWLFWIFIIFVRPAMRTRQQRSHPPQHPYRPNQPPPPIADRYRSEGNTDDSGQWNQPPSR